MSEREEPKLQYIQPCWQLAYSKSSGYDPTYNIANRWWYWREGRSGFGRFETDVEGLFFMRGNPHASSGVGRKRQHVAICSTTDVLSDA